MDPAREAFGDTLRNWFTANGWPQSISEAWAKSCGSPGPWASQISPAMAGKLDPKVTFFIALGQFNQAVSERNVLSVPNERLRGLLAKGQPLTHDNGVPFDADDFFRLFTGRMEPPEYLMRPAPPKDQFFCSDGSTDMETVTIACREAFADIGGKMMLTAAELWMKISPILSEYFNDEQCAHTQRVLMGYETLSAEVPGHVRSLGVGRCVLVIALERVAPGLCKNSTAVSRLDLLTSRTINAGAPPFNY